ncbi:MAG: hypothetical protein ACM3H7_01425 [Acidobacteriaceae bacterium]
MKAGSRNSIFTSVAIFIGLAIVFAILVIAAITAADPVAREVMISVGSAVLGSGLTFFLINMFAVRG